MKAFTLVTEEGKVMSFGAGDRDGGDLIFLVFTSRDKALEIEERLRDGGGLLLAIDDSDAPPLATMSVELRGVELRDGPIRGDIPSTGDSDTEG